MTTFSVNNPYQQFFGLDGLPLTGGKIYVGVAGQDPETSPIAVYSDTGLSIGLAQPIRTVGGYMAASGTPTNGYTAASPYSIRLRNSAGVEVFYNATAHDSIAEALASLGGQFAGSDGASKVGYTLGAAQAVATTIQAKERETVSIADFHAVGDTDYTTALNKAISYANGLGGHMTIMVPQGAFGISGAVTTITAPNVTIMGQSNSGSILNLSYNGPVFTFTGYAGGLENLQLTYPAAPGASAVVVVQDAGTGQNLKNLRVDNIRTLVQAGTPTSAGGALTLSGINGNVYNGGSRFLNLYQCAGVFVQNVGVFVKGVGNPTINRTSTMTTVAGTSFLGLNGFTVDTIAIGSGCIFERWWRVLDLITTAAHTSLCLNVFVDPTVICDYISDDVYHLEAQAGSGGILDVKIHGYANSWSGRTVNINAVSNVRDVDLTEIVSGCSGLEGILIDGGAATHIRMTRPRFVASDRLNTGKAAIRVNNGTHITIINAEAGYSGAYGGLPWQPTYGISIAADLNYITIADCDCDGVTAQYDFAANTTPTGNRRIRDNVSAAYAGIKTGTAPYILPASTVPWVNLTGFEIEITVGGGTVTGIQRNAVVTGMTSGSITLCPGDNFTLTYSSAPSIQFYVKP